MTSEDDGRFEETASGSLSQQARHRESLQREIRRLRKQAEAVRLEAEAAKLDATADELSEELAALDQRAGRNLDEQEAQRRPLPGLRVDTGVESSSQAISSGSTDTLVQGSQCSVEASRSSAVPRFGSWEAIRQARQTANDSAVPVTAANTQPQENALSTDDSATLTRIDAAHSVKPRRPRFLDTKPVDEAAAISGAEQAAAEIDPTNDQESESSKPVADLEAFEVPKSVSLPEFTVDEEGDPEASRERRKPAAFAVSAFLHLIIVFILAGFTLTTKLPKDQVALSASASQSESEAIETFEIETVQPETETTESSESETQYDVSPLGEMSVVDVTSDAIGTMSQPLPSMSSLQQSATQNAAALQAVKGDSQSKMEFCGVEGGGNHFVYLVDSSGSMGDAFVSARRALLDSIDMLTPQQRFYVIFFDAECDYMRITRADQDEPRSVYATPENKSKLRAWAMRIAMDRGKAPYEPLEFALQKLKPDVIFLLSDGEFPARIEDLLMENNRVTNLFGEENPVSIIHTIGYHSREGEERMRRISEKHFGQYRHVPKP